jgi:streptogramin lyase
MIRFGTGVPALRRAGFLLFFFVGSTLGAQEVTEFPVPTASSGPQGIAAGSDGNLWFTEDSANQIGRITPAGVVTEFPITTAGTLPVGIAAGSDGNLWFTERNVGKIGRITVSGVVTEFPIPTTLGYPYFIVPGPDGSLWFPEYNGNQIGRITTAGVVTEFPVPTPGSAPFGVTAGPDGNVWFTEDLATQIGRITMAGVITEFPVPTAGSGPQGIVAGPDGNLWFTEYFGNQIGRISPAGVVTEFPIPTPASLPIGIALGADGNLWFTQPGVGQVARITTAGVITEFPIPTSGGDPNGIVSGPDGNLWFAELNANRIGRVTTGPVTPLGMAVDGQGVAGSTSDVNGVLEPGETVQVAPSWKNTSAIPQSFTGTASNLTGPAGPTYAVDDGSADYGTVSAGAVGDCGANGDGYLMTVSGARPSAHWDATFTESLSSNLATKDWTLHVGLSFPDVPTSNLFYSFVENLFHNGVTGGCGSGDYCPTSSVTRAQMAIFLLKAKFGAGHVPPPATGTVFSDVAVGDFAAAWIEQLAAFQITGGCGGGNYCPGNPVTRAQMAVFLLKAEHGSAYSAPACTGIFADVQCASTFADWIEQLAAEGITGGCGGGNYCPGDPNTRGQMAVFLVKTFGLQLYGP